MCKEGMSLLALCVCLFVWASVVCFSQKEMREIAQKWSGRYNNVRFWKFTTTNQAGMAMAGSKRRAIPYTWNVGDFRVSISYVGLFWHQPRVCLLLLLQPPNSRSHSSLTSLHFTSLYFTSLHLIALLPLIVLSAIKAPPHSHQWLIDWK